MSNDRRIIRRNFAYAECTINVIGLLVIALNFISMLPIDVVSSIPATGGDMGSHFWPLHTLARWGAPHGTFRIWNPGNLCGEPHHLHYFPVPYFVMYLLSIVLPLGTAFNLGSLLPPLLLPATAFFTLRLLRLRFPIPLFGAAASTIFIYNESYSMWGGNLLSLLAGQFTHAFAFLPFVLGFGFLFRSVAHNRIPIAAPILFALVVGSHGYLMVGIPLLALAVLVFASGPSFSRRFILLLVTGLLTALLSLWYLIPMFLNQPWTTPFPQIWRSPKIVDEIFPLTFYPCGVFILGYALVAARKRKAIALHERNVFGAFCLAGLGYSAYYFIFPPLGLVDVRAFPQLHALLAIASGIALGALLRGMGRAPALVMTPLLFAIVIAWSTKPVALAAQWLNWNYSGWEAKAMWPELKPLYESLHGDFNDGRVAYENNPDYEPAGTMRVFEMMPYFTGRATLESVYLQASVVAPEIFYLQALISLRPSCPFMGYECTAWDLLRAEPHLRLLGVSDLLLSSAPLLNQAANTPFLRKNGTFGMLSSYVLEPKPSLVSLFDHPPKLIAEQGWQRAFYDWFATLRADTPLLLVDNRFLPHELREGLANGSRRPWVIDEKCEPTVKVDYNQIVLDTPCPGAAHLLKFSFHPAWKASTGDALFLVSPGFIGIIPSANHIILTFGGLAAWRIADAISLATLLALVGYTFWGNAIMRLFATSLFVILWGASSANAEHITLSANSTYTVTGSETEVQMTGFYSIANTGDALAVAVQPTLALGEWSWAGDAVNLEPNAKHNWEIDVKFPKTLLACGGVPNCPLTLPTRGLFPLLVRRNYSDNNGYKFSTADVTAIEIGPVDPNGAGPIRDRALNGLLSLTGLHGELKVKNQRISPVRAQLSYFGSKDVSLPTAPSIVEIPSGAPFATTFDVQNFSALPGSNYATFAILQWEEGGMRVTDIATGQLRVTQAWSGVTFLVVGLGATLALALVLRKKRS